MENASQALLIAGGILLAILTLALFVYMFSNISTMGNAQARKEEVARITAWNAEWEAYNKNYLYGTEVLTVINKSIQAKADGYNIQIIVDGIDGETMKQEFASNTDKKLQIFSCKDVKYDSEEGRIFKMVFRSDT